MTENNLKNMIENHELDNLMTNGEELEKLKSSRTTEQVLEILKKYNYTETKEVFERELLEILQSIKLNEEEMKNVSGGRLMKTKNLSMVLGSLMALNSAGFMSAGAVAEKQKNTEKYSIGSLLNNVDTNTVRDIGIGAALVGSLWAFTGLITKGTQNKTFTLTEEEQKIYDNTKQLSDMILKYVRDYIEKYKEMPDTELDINNPDHSQMLDMIMEIRLAWISMCEREDGRGIDQNAKKLAAENKKTNFRKYCDFVTESDSDTRTVEICSYAIEQLYYGLPIGDVEMKKHCMPADMYYEESHPYLLIQLFLLDHEHEIHFKALEDSVKDADTCDK